MLIEELPLDGATRNSGAEAAFANEDGSPATWLHVISELSRRRSFARHVGVGLAIAFAIWGLQYSNAVLDFSRGWFGIVPISIGLALGSRAYRKSTVRQFSTVRVRYTEPQRFKRALKWWYLTIMVVALIWWVQPERAVFAGYWWYGWPALPFFVVGVGLYLHKNDTVLSPTAAKAKVHYGSLQQAKQSASANAFFELALVRYPLAALCLYGAYYFGAASDIKNSGWLAKAAIILASFLAKELSSWLLFIVLVGAVIWAVVAGISALPVSAAIIVGALIIANAIKK
jgi:hypothetical protein